MQSLPDILREMAFLAELKDENPFKVRALENAAAALEENGNSIEALVSSGEIKKIKGVGKGTQAIAQEFVSSGKVAEHEALKKDFPSTIFELRQISGLGPKKVKVLFQELGTASLSELEYACQENRLVDLKGFGEKTQQNILKSIARLKNYQGKVILPVAMQEAELVREMLGEVEGVKRVAETGELRRHTEVMGSIDYLLEGDSAKISAGLKKLGWKSPDDAGYFTSTSENGILLRVWISSPAEFGSKWLETTGPTEFVEKMGKLVPASEEESLFRSRKMEFVPPECRELGLHPKSLLEAEEIKGVFHLHTNWSDGKNTLDEMVAAAVDLGYEYIGVSEHSQTAFYAHGLDEKRVRAQREAIDTLQEAYPQIRIFQGIESDILPDGSLDFPDSFLKKFDFVIASVHGRMKMTREEMTKRICRALEHPATTWLGHWSGRLLLGRDPYEFDIEAVLKTAAKERKSIELNSNPYRLDIDWRHLPRAVDLGVPIGIFPDAHSTGGLADVKYGVWMARKAGLNRENIVNTKSRREMEVWLEERKFR
ncbi:MAG: PHP domain-containing protein [Bacteriovoracia bacterium]